MRRTLLEMTQEILTAMGSDQVNSITDTLESHDVASIIRSVFYDSATDLRLHELQTLFELNATTDATKPVMMTLPTRTVRLDWIKYDMIADTETNPLYERIEWLPFEDFLDMSQALREDIINVASMTFMMNGEEFTYLYRTNAHPSFYTFVGTNTILFDSLDTTVDSTLQKSKTMCYGYLYPEFLLEDDYTPPIDPSAFSYLINKAQNKCFLDIKQQASVYATAETRRQKIILRKRTARIADTSEIYKIKARYGRR